MTINWQWREPAHVTTLWRSTLGERSKSCALGTYLCGKISARRARTSFFFWFYTLLPVTICVLIFEMVRSLAWAPTPIPSLVLFVCDEKCSIAHALRNLPIGPKLNYICCARPPWRGRDNFYWLLPAYRLPALVAQKLFVDCAHSARLLAWVAASCRTCAVNYCCAVALLRLWLDLLNGLFASQ